MVDSLNRFTKIYRNDDGDFVDIFVALPPISYGSIAWSDYGRTMELLIASQA